MLMVDMTLDTHAFVKTLTAAGMPEPQAEAVITLVTAARDADAARFISKSDLGDITTKADLEVLATKADLARMATKEEVAGVEAGLKHALAQSEASLRLALAETKADIMKWMIGMIGGAVVVNAVTVVGAMLALLRMAAH
jgi:hypothetical protein